MSKAPSYHDLFIETKEIKRTSIFNLPFELSVTCCRVAGWQLWRGPAPSTAVCVAGEFDRQGLRLDVGGHVICDSLTQQLADERAQGPMTPCPELDNR